MLVNHTNLNIKSGNAQCSSVCCFNVVQSLVLFNFICNVESGCTKIKLFNLFQSFQSKHSIDIKGVNRLRSPLHS